ncbi:MAG: hypothetical protein HKL90_03895 [Elusimicrobia bacterium]|nr:hypothetical protein [Elusimicrobiota bacterium]
MVQAITQALRYAVAQFAAVALNVFCARAARRGAGAAGKTEKNGAQKRRRRLPVRRCLHFSSRVHDYN